MERKEAGDIYFRSRPSHSADFAPFEGPLFEQPRGTYWIRQGVDGTEARVEPNGVLIADHRSGETKWFPDPNCEESDDVSE